VNETPATAQLGPIDYARQQQAEREAAAVPGWAPHMDAYAKNFPAPAPAADRRVAYAEVLWPLVDWDGDRMNAEAAADAVIAVADREQEQLRVEVQRRREEQPWLSATQEDLADAQAALDRVRKLADRWENALAPDRRYAEAIRAALDPQEQP